MWLQDPKVGCRIFKIVFRIFVAIQNFSQIHCLLESIVPGFFWLAAKFSF